ncbi:uncharacterized protein [Drosophila bipectinata]|uniref:uncharacterized protein isoform X4 n=1 Tax=Drosophila bipectinata TaxID=42026 RepID=UPI0038B380B3
MCTRGGILAPRSTLISAVEIAIEGSGDGSVKHRKKSVKSRNEQRTKLRRCQPQDGSQGLFFRIPATKAFICAWLHFN